MNASVSFTPTARGHFETIDAWWRIYRPAAPELFAEELAAAVNRLEIAPLSGLEYDAGESGCFRRLLLQRTRYHVYYRFNAEDSTVHIHVIWHTARGTGPDLK